MPSWLCLKNVSSGTEWHHQWRAKVKVPELDCLLLSFRWEEAGSQTSPGNDAWWCFSLALCPPPNPPLYLWFKHFGHSSQMTTECVSQHEEVLETWERRLAKCFIVQDINRTVENSENVCVCGGGWVELFIIFAAYKHMQIHSACHAAGMRYPIFAFHLFPQDLSYQLALLQI